MTLLCCIVVEIRQEAGGSRRCLSILGCGRPKYPRYPFYLFDDRVVTRRTRTVSVKSAADNDLVETLADVHANEGSARKASVGIIAPVRRGSQWSWWFGLAMYIVCCLFLSLLFAAAIANKWGIFCHASPGSQDGIRLGHFTYKIATGLDR